MKQKIILVVSLLSLVLILKGQTLKFSQPLSFKEPKIADTSIMIQFTMKNNISGNKLKVNFLDKNDSTADRGVDYTIDDDQFNERIINNNGLIIIKLLSKTEKNKKNKTIRFYYSIMNDKDTIIKDTLLITITPNSDKESEKLESPIATVNEKKSEAYSATKMLIYDSCEYIVTIIDSTKNIFLSLCKTKCNKRIGNIIKPISIVTDNCKSAYISSDTEVDQFKVLFCSMLEDLSENNITDEDPVRQKAEDLFLKWKSELKADKATKDKMKAEANLEKEKALRQKEKDSLLLSFADEKEDAVVLKINEKVFVLKDTLHSNEQRSLKDSLLYSVLNNYNPDNYNPIKPLFFEVYIDCVFISVANNTINQIDINSHWIDESGSKWQIPIITNNDYGIPLRSLVDNKETIIFPLFGTSYVLWFGDLFQIGSTKNGPISYMLRDSTYSFFPDTALHKNKMVLARKRFLDYISASAFFNLFGLTNDNTSKVINTEVRTSIPINHSKRLPKTASCLGRPYFFRNFNLDVNLGADVGTFTKADNTLNPVYNYTTNGVSAGDSTKRNWINTFDLLRNNYLRINPFINLLSYDLKRFNLFWDFDMGMHSFFTSTRIIGNSGKDTSNQTVFSVSPELSTRFRINPQPGIGFDLLIGYLWNYRSNDRNIYEVTGRETTEELIVKPKIDASQNKYLRLEFNFYFNPKIAKSSTERGGWYIKGLYFKNLNNVNGFPQFMVGYSSDIRRFFRY